jgi:hypothetical protein
MCHYRQSLKGDYRDSIVSDDRIANPKWGAISVNGHSFKVFENICETEITMLKSASVRETRPLT